MQGNVGLLVIFRCNSVSSSDLVPVFLHLLGLSFILYLLKLSAGNGFCEHLQGLDFLKLTAYSFVRHCSILLHYKSNFRDFFSKIRHLLVKSKRVTVLLQRPNHGKG